MACHCVNRGSVFKCGASMGESLGEWSVSMPALVLYLALLLCLVSDIKASYCWALKGSATCLPVFRGTPSRDLQELVVLLSSPGLVDLEVQCPRSPSNPW